MYLTRLQMYLPWIVIFFLTIRIASECVLKSITVKFLFGRKTQSTLLVYIVIKWHVAMSLKCFLQPIKLERSPCNTQIYVLRSRCMTDSSKACCICIYSLSLYAGQENLSPSFWVIMAVRLSWHRRLIIAVQYLNQYLGFALQVPTVVILSSL